MNEREEGKGKKGMEEGKEEQAAGKEGIRGGMGKGKGGSERGGKVGLDKVRGVRLKEG